MFLLLLYGCTNNYPLGTTKWLLKWIALKILSMLCLHFTHRTHATRQRSNFSALCKISIKKWLYQSNLLLSRIMMSLLTKRKSSSSQPSSYATFSSKPDMLSACLSLPPLMTWYCPDPSNRIIQVDPTAPTFDSQVEKQREQHPSSWALVLPRLHTMVVSCTSSATPVLILSSSSSCAHRTALLVSLCRSLLPPFLSYLLSFTSRLLFFIFPSDRTHISNTTHQRRHMQRCTNSIISFFF